jgi:hypothetical protein
MAQPNANPREGRVMGMVLSWLFLLVLAYWAAGPLHDTPYIYGYPTIGIPPGPNQFVSTLYGWQWAFVWLLISNYAPPIIFLLAMNLPKHPLVTFTHFWASIISGIMTIVSFATLLVTIFVDCNWSYSNGSICSDPLWCCIYFASAPNLCPNVAPCPGTINLYPNSSFVQHVVFGAVFIITGTVEIYLNYRMVVYGVFAS